MQKHLKNQIKSHFTIIPNSLINDRNLSDRARFIFCLMASKPDDWKFYNSSLAKELGYHEDTLRKYISELIESGWLTKQSEVGEPNKYTLQPTKFSDSENLRHRESPTPESSETYKEVFPTKKYFKERSSSKSAREERKTSPQQQPIPGHAAEFSEKNVKKVMQEWNKASPKKCKEAEFFAIQRLVREILNSVEADCNISNLITAIQNHGVALKLPDSQARPCRLARFLQRIRDGTKNYLPAFFDIDDFKKSNFEKAKKRF